MNYDEAVKLTIKLSEIKSFSEVSKEDVTNLMETVALCSDPEIRLKNQLKGKMKCQFPNCWCNAPWENCEEKYETAATP